MFRPFRPFNIFQPFRTALGQSVSAILRTADFYAPLTTSLVLEKGTGQATFTRGTNATVEVNDGANGLIQRTALIGEARFPGARRVENRLKNTELLTASDWTWTGVPPNASELKEDLSTGTHRMSQGYVTIGFSVVGEYQCSSVEIKSNGGPRSKVVIVASGTSKGFDANSGAAFSTVYNGIDASVFGSEPVGDGWYRVYVIGIAQSIYSSFELRLCKDDGFTNYTGDGHSGVLIRRPQFELVTGQAVQTAGEYVSNGAIRRNLLINTDKLESWSGTAIVTENTDIAPNGLLVADTLTDNNSGTYLNRLQTVTIANDSAKYTLSLRVKKTTSATNTFGVNIGLYGGTGLQIRVRLNTNSGVGSGNGFVSVETDPDAEDYWKITGAVTNNSSGNTTLTVSIYPAAGTNVGDNPGSDSETATGSAIICFLQIEKGEIATSYQKITDASPADFNNYHGAGVDGVKYFDTLLDGSKIPDAMLKGYLAEGSRTNLLLNSATLSTQNVTVTAQSYCLSFWGTGTVTLSGTYSGSLVGTGASNRVYLAFTPTAGTLTLTVSGSVLNAQLEAGSFPSSYIPTTSATVTRAADVLTYPAGNVLGTEGSAMAEIRTNWTAQDGKNRKVLSVGSSRPALFFDTTSGKLSLNDGTADRTGNVFTGASTAQKVASKWGGTSAKTFIGGVASADLSFDGDMDVGTMTVGADSAGANQLSGTIRAVRVWKSVLADSDLQSITK